MARHISSNLAVNETYSSAKRQIEDKDYKFCMRTKQQQEYHPKNVGSFIAKKYEHAYMLRDMASLVSSNEISNFLADFAYKLTSDKMTKITQEELNLVISFVRDSKTMYRNSDYVDLTKYVSQ